MEESMLSKASLVQACNTLWNFAQNEKIAIDYEVDVVYVESLIFL